MRPGPPGRSGERGFALATALMVLLIVSLSLALVAASVGLHLRHAREEAQSLRRTALADAALAEALAHLALDPGYTGEPEHPFEEGSIGSRVEPLGAGAYRILARAALAGRARAAEARALRTPLGKVTVVRWQPVRPGA